VQKNPGESVIGILLRLLISYGNVEPENGADSYETRADMVEV